VINHRRELRGRLQLSLREKRGGGPHQESHMVHGTVEVGPDLECWFNAADIEELLQNTIC
jgi:hypothetical protein